MIRPDMGNEKPELRRSKAGRTPAGLPAWLDGFEPCSLPNGKTSAEPNNGHVWAQATQAIAQTLHSVLEVVPAAALVIDEAGNVAWANGMATRVLGYALAELTGMRIESVLVAWRGDARPVSFAALKNPEGLPHSVTRVAVARAKNGADIDVHVSASASLAAEPAARMVVVIEPENREPALAQSRDEPRRLRRERASEVGDMAAALAHEVDQPLTAILSNAQAAQRFLAQNPPAMSDLRELLGEVVSDSTRAHAIIRKMRQSARCEPPEMCPVDVGSLVRDVVRLLRRETETCGAAVSARIEDGLPQVHGDAVQLQQVLVNLLLNALDAVHDCRAEDRRVCVVVGASEDRGKVRLAIRDHGPGVDADRLVTLFKPFMTSKPHGLGLGLSISRTIVMAHGGQLWAERHADSGLTFHVELPAEGACLQTTTRCSP